MRPKAAESIITSYEKSRAHNLIVLVEFYLRFTSKSGFQLLLDVLLSLHLKKIARIELAFKIEAVYARSSFFFKNFNFFKGTVNVLRLVFSGF